MELDVKAIDNAVSAVDEAADMVNKSLDCEWDDPVHESFYGFVEDFSATNKDLGEICDDIKGVAAKVRDVDVGKLQNVLNTLMNHMPKEKK